MHAAEAVDERSRHNCILPAGVAAAKEI
jgi:hypothetical protein